MGIDIFGTVIFAFFALLVFKHNFTIKLTIFWGVVAAILPLISTKVFTYLPYLITEMPLKIALTPTQAEMTITLVQIPVVVLILLIIRKDTEGLYRFGVWVVIGIFVNDMLLPFVIHQTLV
jgi:hypothetical protein